MTSTPQKPMAARENSSIHLLLAAVIAVAMVGYLVGLRQGKTPYVPPESAFDKPLVASAAIPSTTWRKFNRRTMGPNSQWHVSVSALRQPVVDILAPVASLWNDVDRQALLQARAKRRAFDGAPPVVPHPIDQMSASSCLVCHGKGLTISTAHAPQLPHSMLLNCTQCHVEQSSTMMESFLIATNDFNGLSAPTQGTRAWSGAPPTIPHSTFMRESCMSCHGPTGHQAIRSSHPWRANCLQCHAPSADFDQTGARGKPEFLPPPKLEQK